MAVVDDWMRYLVPKGRLTNTGCLALRDIFAAMHSNDNNVVGILLFDLPQLRQNVNAVDSAIGPEIEEDHTATQALERERLSTGVNPVETRRKLRSPNAW